MSRLVPKHFDEKNMEKEEENTTHDFFNFDDNHINDDYEDDHQRPSFCGSL